MSQPYLDIFLWLLIGPIGLAVVAYVALIVWATTRKLKHGELFAPSREDGQLVLPAAGQLVVRSDPFGIAAIWISLLILVPLLILALWAAAVEIASRTVGAGLLFAIVHPFLVWQMIRLGTHVQRAVDLSHSGLTTHPVFGPSREIAWSAIDRVRDVTYAGPAVSGLYVSPIDGGQVVLDRWLPDWEPLRDLVHELTPHAKWTIEHRGAIG